MTNDEIDWIDTTISDYFGEDSCKSLKEHEKMGGKIEISCKSKLDDRTLPILYTPHVADVCKELKKDFRNSFKYTWRKNTIAIVSDGSATLGLGNMGIGVLPVLEGKSMIFKQMARINAIPIYINTMHSHANITPTVNAIVAISETFGAICIEDIAAPICFEIEKMLIETLNIPVVHDDQHATCIAILSALFKSLELVGKKMENIKVVVCGAGAGGTALVSLLLYNGVGNLEGYGDIIVLDSKGVIDRKRSYHSHKNKEFMSLNTNRYDISGGLEDAIYDADVFIGLSVGNIFKPEYINLMKNNGNGSIIFALANPTPEINPMLAYEYGAHIVCSGRSDFPNQINNAIVFPGLFKGLLDHNVKLDNELKTLIAKELTKLVNDEHPVITHVFDRRLVKVIYDVVVNYKK